MESKFTHHRGAVRQEGESQAEYKERRFIEDNQIIGYLKGTVRTGTESKPSLPNNKMRKGNNSPATNGRVQQTVYNKPVKVLSGTRTTKSGGTKNVYKSNAGFSIVRTVTHVR